MNKKKMSFYGFLLLSLFFLGMCFVPTMANVGVPLQDHISLTGYAYTAADVTVDKDDYMLVDRFWYSSMGESIWSSDGETSAGSGTSYLSLEDSCIIGDYGSYPLSWADFSYVKASYSATEAEIYTCEYDCLKGGDTAADGVTDPAFSSDPLGASYISCAGTFETAATDGGSAAETITWTAEAWRDLDGDGTDDSSTVHSFSCG